MQTARVAGSGNVIVQIGGDGNSVIVGRPHLTLTRPRGLASRIRTDPDTGKPNRIDVIRADTRSVDLVGRRTEFGDLRSWLHVRSPVSVRLLVGKAGLGKTRLALELIEAIAQDGWRAGFLSRDELHRFRQQQNLTDWGWDTPVLAVVDYASASVRELHAWLKELADNPIWDDEAGCDRPLRLLLLERHAERETGWWTEVLGTGSAAVAIEQMVDLSGPMVLQPIRESCDRRTILTDTLRRLGSCVSLPAPSDDPDFDRRLAEQTWGGVPLMLMMAAATAAHAGFGGVLAMGSDELAFKIAEIEMARILKVAEGWGVLPQLAPLVKHVIGITVLRQGLEAMSACAVIEDESAALGYDVAGGPAVLRDALAAALPDGAGGIAAVEPDLVGEALLLLAWQGHDDHRRPALARAHADDPAPVRQTVVRTCQDYVIRGHRYALAWLRQILSATDDLIGLTKLSQVMPKETLELREVGLILEQKIVDLARNQARSSSPTSLEILAHGLNNLSLRLSQVGNRDDALAAIKEAVDLYRDLGAAQPDALRPDLARSLANLSNRMMERGRVDDALAAILEAVELFRNLAVVQPDVYRPYFAAVLNNLSSHLSECGRNDDALAAIEEALSIRRDLAAERPDAFRPDLASSLQNMSTRLIEHGRRDEALSAIQEAIHIYQDLAAGRPDAFLPDLASALNNISNHLSEHGRRDDALTAIEQTVNIRRDLAAARPAAFRSDLAISLNNFSVHLSECGRWVHALAAVQEAVQLFRDGAHTDVFRRDLAGALVNLYNRLSENGRRGEAYVAIQEAVELYRGLVDVNPDAFLSDLGNSLLNFSVALSDRGELYEALTIGRESVKIYQKLAKKYPAAFRSHLASALNNLSNRLFRCDLDDEGLEASQEAVRLYRDLAALHPDTFRHSLASSLSNLSNLLSSCGQIDDALTASEESVTLYRELVATNRDVFVPALASSLNNLSNRLCECGRTDEALVAVKASLEVLQELFLSFPVGLADRIDVIVGNYRRQCRAAGEQIDADLLLPIDEMLRRVKDQSGR